MQRVRYFLVKDLRIKTNRVNFLGIGEGKLPIKYLGLSLSANYLRAKDYSSVIDKCTSRFKDQEANILSFAGRIELLKTVIHNTLAYWLHFFKPLISVIRKLKRMSASPV